MLSFSQRLKVAVDVACCLLYLHDRGMIHGNLKPTNILLKGPDYNARLTDYGLDRLMTPAGIAEQILNQGALGCWALELDNASKPAPSFKADVYVNGKLASNKLSYFINPQFIFLFKCISYFVYMIAYSLHV